MPFLQSCLVAFTRLVTGANAVWLEEQLQPGPVRIYFANHGSHLDFATVYATLPSALRARTRPVAARDYWMKNRLARFFAVRLSNALLISRDVITREDNPVEQMAVALREGWSLILFPEGTRSMDGAIAPFKAGLYHLAAKAPEIELVPVYLQNLNRILPKGHLLPVPLLGTVVFGAPIKLEVGERKADFLKRSREVLMGLVPPGSA